MASAAAATAAVTHECRQQQQQLQQQLKLSSGARAARISPNGAGSWLGFSWYAETFCVGSIAAELDAAGAVVWGMAALLELRMP
jgi:hypothetical protein